MDLDHDNDLDLMVAENRISGVTHGVYFHSGNNSSPYGSFSPAQQVDWARLGITQEHYGFYDARYGDLDLDGTLDLNSDGIPDNGTIEIVLVNQNVDNSGGVTRTVVQVLSVHPSAGLIDRTPDFMPPSSSLTGGMGVDLGDLDGDGDLDMVFGGATLNASGLSEASATLYENRTYTRLENRNIPNGRVVGRRELTAGSGVNVLAGRTVTFEAAASVGGRIVLKPGFRAWPGSVFVARIR